MNSYTSTAPPQPFTSSRITHLPWLSLKLIDGNYPPRHPHPSYGSVYLIWCVISCCMLVFLRLIMTFEESFDISQFCFWGLVIHLTVSWIDITVITGKKNMMITLAILQTSSIWRYAGGSYFWFSGTWKEGEALCHRTASIGSGIGLLKAYDADVY
jgi:hypothetical protein